MPESLAERMAQAAGPEATPMGGGDLRERMADATRSRIKEKQKQYGVESGNWWERQATQFGATITGDIAAIPGAVSEAVRHPLETVKGIGRSQGAELDAALSAYKRKDWSEVARHGFGYLVPIAGPALVSAGDEAARGEYGTALAHTVELTPLPEMAVKGVGKLAGQAKRLTRPIAQKTAQSIYEAELRPGAKMSLPQREEIVGRGLKPTQELPIERPSLETLHTEATKFKAEVTRVTSDPVYGGRTIPIDSVLSPVDKWIKRVTRADRGMGQQLMRRRLEWAKQLGYQEPKAASTRAVSTGLLDPQGKPLMRDVTTPAVPGRDWTTVKEAQQLKEDLYAIINSNAYSEAAEPGAVTAGKKLAARGLKHGIETTVPEEPLKAINHAIEVDLRLKDTINLAIKRHPSWINDWAVFVLGAGAGEAIGGHIGGEVVAVGALARMAARNPRIMSRLAIALNRSGVPLSIEPITMPARGVEMATRPRRQEQPE